MGSVLVACEFSQIVARAFREEGHEAYSCDLLPTEGNPKWHIEGDVLEQLDKNWDLMIGHPNCQFLCNSGVRWLYQSKEEKNQDRWNKMLQAKDFFMKLYNADISRICIENPIPHKHSNLPKYSQKIQPYDFGHGETKATCLWLKKLPKLQKTTNIFDWNNLEYKLEEGREQRVHLLPPSETRWMERARTFTGVASAMAKQWGPLLN